MYDASCIFLIVLKTVIPIPVVVNSILVMHSRFNLGDKDLPSKMILIQS